MAAKQAVNIQMVVILLVKSTDRSPEGASPNPI